jgi:uncharacterized membrane protein
MVPVPDVLMGMGILTVLVCIPLVLRMVPMNRAYGVRTRSAFMSDRHWYEINAYGGKLLIVFGLFLVAFGYFTRDMAPSPRSLWAPVYMVAPLLAILPVLARIRAFSRRLPDR